MGNFSDYYFYFNYHYDYSMLFLFLSETGAERTRVTSGGFCFRKLAAVEANGFKENDVTCQFALR